MMTTALIAIALVIAIAAKYLLPRVERCPECNAIRDEDSPICSSCEWIYETPDDDEPLEYGDDDDL